MKAVEKEINKIIETEVLDKDKKVEITTENQEEQSPQQTDPRKAIEDRCKTFTRTCGAYAENAGKVEALKMVIAEMLTAEKQLQADLLQAQQQLKQQTNMEQQ